MLKVVRFNIITVCGKAWQQVGDGMECHCNINGGKDHNPLPANLSFEEEKKD